MKTCFNLDLKEFDYERQIQQLNFSPKIMYGACNFLYYYVKGRKADRLIYALQCE